MEKSTGKFSFPKIYRITNTYEYRQIYKTGQKVRSKNFLLFFTPSDAGCSRVGISAGRKVGRSHTRNKVKRRMREILRFYRCRISSPVNLVLVAHPQAATLSYSDMDREIRKMLHNARIIQRDEDDNQ